MTRTDVMASSRPRTAVAASNRKGSRAMRRLTLLPILLLALDGPSGARVGPGRLGIEHQLRLQPGTQQTEHGHLAVERNRKTATTPSPKRLRRPPRRRKPPAEDPSLHGLRPALELRSRPAPDGRGLLDRRGAAPPAPRGRSLAAHHPTGECRRSILNEPSASGPAALSLSCLGRAPRGISPFVP